MKAVIAALGLVACLGMGTGLRADIKYLWLDHPKGRNNPNDPGSPQYISAAAASVSFAPAHARLAGAAALGAHAPRVVFDDFESDAWKPAPSYMYSEGPSQGAVLGGLSATAAWVAPDGGRQSMLVPLSFTAARGCGQLWIKS